MKQQLESINAERFSKRALSAEAMRMINGGGSVKTTSWPPDDPKNTSPDTTYYQCCEGLYDKTTIFADRTSSSATSKEMWPGTTASDYND